LKNKKIGDVILKHQIAQLFVSAGLGLCLAASGVSVALAEQNVANIRIEVSPDVWPCFPMEYTIEKQKLLVLGSRTTVEVTITEGARYLSDEKIRDYCLSHYQNWERPGNTWMSDIYPNNVLKDAQRVSYSDFYAQPATLKIYSVIVGELVNYGDLRSGYITSALLVAEIGNLVAMCGAVPELQTDFPETCNYSQLEDLFTDAVRVFHQVRDDGGADAVGPGAQESMGEYVANGIAMFEATPPWA
jgi:hypothetical protein